jgi:hypothetical protein
MTTGANPIVDQWYSQPDQDLRFQVVAIDPEERDVEIQYGDGAVDILSFDDWYHMNLDRIATPPVGPDGTFVASAAGFADSGHHGLSDPLQEFTAEAEAEADILRLMEQYQGVREDDEIDDLP